MAPWFARLAKRQREDALDGLTLAPGAVEAFQLLRARGIVTAIVSITWELAVSHFAHTLGADRFVGTRVAATGEIEHFWPRQKGVWLTDLAERLDLRRESVAAIGDSRGDLELLRAASLASFVGLEPLVELSRVRHRPGANVLDVTREIVGLAEARPAERGAE